MTSSQKRKLAYVCFFRVNESPSDKLRCHYLNDLAHIFGYHTYSRGRKTNNHNAHVVFHNN